MPGAEGTRSLQKQEENSKKGHEERLEEGALECKGRMGISSSQSE